MQPLLAIIFPFLILFTVWTPITLSQVPLGVPAVSPSPSQSDLIGVAAAVRGTVELSRAGVVGKKVESGENIYLGDKITTDNNGRMQILLLDETVFTIGPNSSMTIDKFVYNPTTHDGELEAKIMKGVFRFVTGKIAHKKPRNMRVDLPAGRIGIRGTIVAGEVNGMRSFVVLMGPGDLSSSENTAGAMTLSNEVNGKTETVEINRPGYGSRIEGKGFPPLKPFDVPRNQLNALMQSLSLTATDQSGTRSQSAPQSQNNANQRPNQPPPGGPPPGGGPPQGGLRPPGSPPPGGNTGMLDTTESASSIVGQDNRGTMRNAILLNNISRDMQRLDDVTNPSQNPPRPPASSAGRSYHFESSGVALISNGSYDFRLVINALGFGGPNSYVTGTAVINGQNASFNYLIPPTSYSELNQATYSKTFTNLIDSDISDGVGKRQPSTITIDFPVNPAREVPTRVYHEVTVEKFGDPASTVTGNATASPAIDGA